MRKLCTLAFTCAAGTALVACGSDSGSKQDTGVPDTQPAADAPATPDTGKSDVALHDTADAPKVPDLPLADARIVVDTPTSPIDGQGIDVPAVVIDGGPAIDAAAIDGAAIDGPAGEVGKLDGGQRFNAAYVELQPEKFQATVEGKATALYTIKNSKGMFARITNMGAKFEQIVVPDRHGVWGDVILGYESIDQVRAGQGSMGAFIGRYANRIGGGTFVLDGTTYSIAVNEPAPKNNLLHGGAKGSRFRVFDATQVSDSAVKMSLTFLDAEDADAATAMTGFPGKVEMTVTYSISESNEIHVDYSAKSLDTKQSVINMTTHSFFNLGDSPATPILDHVIRVNADKVLAINERLLPTGELRDVTGTPMDFRTAKTFRQDYQADYDLLKLVGGGGAGIAAGYDNHYALNKPTAGELSFAASAYEPVSGRKMEVWSTEPGMQLFTGQNLTGQVPRDTGKGGVTYVQYDAFCLEPSHFPDAPNQPTFPTTVLGAGQTYTGKIVYKFGVGP